MAYDFDLFVVGGGSGGIAAASRAAGHGARVALAEADRLGGTCVNRGCVPKKLMVYAARFSDQFTAAASYGWQVEQSTFHWPTLRAAIAQETERLNGVYQAMLDDAGVALFPHYARFVDGHTLAVGDRTVTAAKILIAVGGRPKLPGNIPGIEHAITSDDIFHLPQQPRRLVIIGGGYIGSEFACILNGLGTEVIQIIRADRVLRGFDDDLRCEIHGAMQQRGIKIIAHSESIAIAPAEAGVTVTVTTPHGQDTLLCDAVNLAATGRIPNLEGLGLERIGVQLKEGAIAVDAQQRTSVSHIFAVGDVTEHPSLTPVALREGRQFADAEFGPTPVPINYDAIPSAVFTTPEMSTVGLTEVEAQTKFGPGDVQIYRTHFRPLHNTLSNLETKALVKLVVQTSTDRVLGAHMVGDHAAEIMQGIAIALTMGATKADFDVTVAIHPSIAEEFVGLE
ncbi:glutathione-disulfide reductase [Nodosilinea nodulosa]|uniref:glutathione-disulfide reductase n=1 Tax=Nodosilinea nodulosa TaxID=416001 RepID=UPI0002EF6569|nr:glutathione-disulfide reductase [Nodosilinea nodulosa]